MKTIKNFFINIYRYYVIRKELKYRLRGRKLRGYKLPDDKYLDLLTKSLYKSSKIVKKDVDESKKRIDDFNNTNLVNGIRNFINKYYNDREIELNKREIELNKLELKIKNNEKNNK
jgi:hypothetical protein